MTRTMENSKTTTFSISRSWWLVLLFGIVSCLFGIGAMLDPVRAGVSISWAMGVLALVEGVVALVGVFNKYHPLPRAWLLVYAAFSLLFGILAVVNPVSMAEAFIMVMGFWFVLAGAMRIAVAVRVRKEIKNEWSLILSGVLAIVLGCLLLMTPLAGLILAVIWIGVAALVYGLLQIFAASRLRKLAR
jgi:uncharacterized membrane protein HdeD (DUF308 family)